MTQATPTIVPSARYTDLSPRTALHRRFLFVYGLSLPTNLPFPSRKLIAFSTFWSTLSSDFKNEIYLMISCLFDGDKPSKTFFASGFFLTPSIISDAVRWFWVPGQKLSLLQLPLRFGSENP
jgi:hypothetical protein